MTDVLRVHPTLSIPPYMYTTYQKHVPSTKKVYYCQRCLNHGQYEPRKNHKCDCKYSLCKCEQCGLVDQRRLLNTKLQELELGNEKLCSEDDDEPKGKGERVPNCQKCGQHGRKSRLKGHKRVCPFRDCTCAKCAVVTERQKLMADQIKIRRRQRKDTLLNLTREHFTLGALQAVAPFNLQSLNKILYGPPMTTPQPLLSSPTSSEASSYSPQFPTPPMPQIINSSADHSPTTLTPVSAAAAAAVTVPTTTSTPILASIPINQPQPFFPFGQTSQESALFLQALLAQYKLFEDGTSLSLSSSPAKEDDDDNSDDSGINNCIIDVCSV